MQVVEVGYLISVWKTFCEFIECSFDVMNVENNFAGFIKVPT